MARKVALVTGGARGIGRGIVAALAADHDVAVHHNSTAPIDGSGRNYACDLTAEGACTALVADIIADHGRLDVIVNNAGSIAVSPLDTFDAAEYARIFAVNVLAPHALLAAALPHLEPGSCVINISSMNAELPPKGAVMYGASKAALNNWTRGAAKELGPRGIRVNAVAPGAIDTPEAPRDAEMRQAFVDLQALDRVGAPDDIAKAVLYLASDAARFVTGAILPVTGGYRL